MQTRCVTLASGCSAVGARLDGVQEVGGSNPPIPTEDRHFDNRRPCQRGGMGIRARLKPW